MADGRRKLVVIDEGLIATMAANSNFVKEFPFLASLARLGAQPQKPGCGGCTRNAVDNNATYAAARSAIGSMADSKKIKMKQMLNAKQVLITYKMPGGNKTIDRYF